MTIPTVLRVISNALPTAFQGGGRSNPYNPMGVGTPRWKTGLNAEGRETTRRAVRGASGPEVHRSGHAHVAALLTLE